MASWIDVFSLVATIAVLGGAVYGILVVVRTINKNVASTKESLKSRGLDVSSKGVSVKTSKHFGRSDYFDATQRHLVKAFESSSFRKDEGDSASSPSTNIDEKSKKKHLFHNH